MMNKFSFEVIGDKVYLKYRDMVLNSDENSLAGREALSHWLKMNAQILDENIYVPSKSC